jgi:hypothetical protein
MRFLKSNITYYVLVSGIVILLIMFLLPGLT